jgi:hypothetical protein
VESLPAMLGKVAAAGKGLEREDAAAFAPVAELARDLSARNGREVATVGVAGDIVANAQGAYLYLQPPWDSSPQNRIVVRISQLPLQRKKELLGLLAPQHALIVKGTVRALVTGGYGLELASYYDLGAAPRVFVPTQNMFQPWKIAASCPKGEFEEVSNWPFLGDMVCRKRR